MSKNKASIAVVLLLVIGQLHTALHAAEFGAELHHHDGAVCVFTLPDEEHDAVVPQQAQEPALNWVALNHQHPKPHHFVVPALALRPPANGPPIY